MKTNDRATSVVVDGVRALLTSAGIPQDRIERAIAIIEGRECAVPVALDDMAVVTRQRVAKLMGFRDSHAVDAYRKAGRLTPVFFPGGSRVRGFTAQSVRALLNGGTVVAKKGISV